MSERKLTSSEVDSASSFPSAPDIMGLDEVRSPALLIFPDRVESNLKSMVSRVGDPSRLRPHMKTHKMGAVLEIQKRLGVSKVKCATLAEMVLALDEGLTDVFLSHQPVGPNGEILRELARRYRNAQLSSLVDDLGVIQHLGSLFEAEDRPLTVYLDLDNGMGRSGIIPGEDAFALYQRIVQTPGLVPGGLHAYDGQLRQSQLEERAESATLGMESVWALHQRLCEAGMEPPCVVVGGTPTFPVHAKNPKVICSPGTCVFWDAGYAVHLPDLQFEQAAWLLTRIISKPGANRLCLDLGHKSVAAENPIENRVRFPEIPRARFISQSEEHLVIETDEATQWKVGDTILGIPWHICPTVALYDQAVVIEGGRPTSFWPIRARSREIPA